MGCCLTIFVAGHVLSQHIAVIIVVLDLSDIVGIALGLTVASDTWTYALRRALEKYLPDDASIDYIYGSIYLQLAYTAGSPSRDAIA